MRESNIRILQLRQLHCKRISAKALSDKNDLIVEGGNSMIYVGSIKDHNSKIISSVRSGKQKKGIFRLLQNFLRSNLGHESLLFKQCFPKNIWISSSTQLGEHPNFSLNAEEGLC